MQCGGPVALDIGDVGNGQGGQRQIPVRGRHIGEAQAHGSFPVGQIFFNPQANPLLDLHRAAAEHQAVPERVRRPLCEPTFMAQPDLVPDSQRVEGQRAEAGSATSV